MKNPRPPNGGRGFVRFSKNLPGGACEGPQQPAPRWFTDAPESVQLFFGAGASKVQTVGKLCKATGMEAMSYEKRRLYTKISEK